MMSSDIRDSQRSGLIERCVDSFGLVELVWKHLWTENPLCIMSFVLLGRRVPRYHDCHHFEDEDVESQRG